MHFKLTQDSKPRLSLPNIARFTVRDDERDLDPVLAVNVYQFEDGTVHVDISGNFGQIPFFKVTNEIGMPVLTVDGGEFSHQYDKTGVA